MHDDLTGPSPLSYDEWRAKLELLGARYHPTGVDRHAFLAGCVRAGSVILRQLNSAATRLRSAAPSGTRGLMTRTTT